MPKLSSINQVRVLLRLLAPWGLLILALISIVNYARVSQMDWNGYVHDLAGMDDVTRWENRFTELKSRLPANVGNVGYISTDPQYVEFELTQYALIPFVLHDNKVLDWTIIIQQGKPIHLVLEKLGLINYSTESFGYGIYLVHK
jgi:hypothetical protein